MSNKKHLIGIRAGLIQQKKAAQDTVRAIGMQLEAVEDQIVIQEIEALQDMPIGTFIALDSSEKYFIPATPETPSTSFVGFLAHDVRAGQILIFDPRKNTEDVIVKQPIGMAISSETLQIGDAVYKSKDNGKWHKSTG